MADIFLPALLFLVSALGLAWPIAARLALEPGEQLGVSVALSLIGVWLIAWAVYVFALPTGLLWAVPAVGLLNLALNRASLWRTLRGAAATELIAAQAIVTASSVGWLALIVSYAGGDWVGDWFGHWDRAKFFLERWPRDLLFTGFDPLTSRPPLANVVTGAFLRVTRIDFAHYQLVTTLLNSLAFLPAALLARRFHQGAAPGATAGATRVVRILAVLVMLNPLFVQNTTYAWTKLVTAFYVLTALYFFLRTRDADAPRSAGVLCAVCLAAGMLTHYSAGPYVVLLVVAWLGLGRSRWRDARWQKETVVAASAGALLLATWFLWSIAVFGGPATVLTNPSVTAGSSSAAEHVGRALLNIRDTFIPHFLRRVDFTAFAQRSVWGGWRDWSFLLYQRNLLFATGAVAWIAILMILQKNWRVAPPRNRWFWTSFVAGTTVLGIAAHGPRDPWGNTHIGEQPLVLIGLALLAAHWPQLHPMWRRGLIAGAACDFILGIGLHFGVQSYLIDRWLTPGRSPDDYFTSYSEFALMNLRAKFQLKLPFFGDTLPAHPALVLALLSALLILALTRAKDASPRNST